MVSAFRCGEDLVLEKLALRQQLLALHAKRRRRRLTAVHKLYPRTKIGVRAREQTTMHNLILYSFSPR